MPYQPANAPPTRTLDHDKLFGGLVGDLGRLVNVPHTPTLREIADIEREPPAEFPPPDPLADMRENVGKHLPIPYRRMVVAWIELAFAKGQCNAPESMLRKLRGGGDRV